MGNLSASSKKVALLGSERKPLEGATKGANVADDEIIRATVVLHRRTVSTLPAMETFAFSHTRSVPYRSRSEFGILHGAEPRDIEMVLEMAHEHGLTVAQVNAAARTVVLTGPASAMQQAFGSTLSWYDSPKGRFRGRTGPILLPEALQPRVMAVLGLDNRPVAKPHVRLTARSEPAGSFTPPELAQLYNFPSGVDGSGQTIGIIELGGGYRTSDLKAYFKGLGLPVPSVTAVSVDGGQNSPGTDPGNDGEVMLDIEVSAGVAPGAHIVVYFAGNTDQGFHDAISQAVHDTVNNPSVISISWGGVEDQWTPQARDAMEAAVQDAAAMLVTVTAAAGDDGATETLSGGYYVEVPACLPEVLGCGGTNAVRSAAGGLVETVWNELAKNEGATGGGVSRIIPLPAYQASANVPLQPQTNFKGRGVPDVAGDADPETGYWVRVDGKNTVIGGTSAVAPLWAGLIARINQRLGKPVGFVNPVLYQIGSSVFNDITQGNNGPGNTGYSARAGWDPCTGLGTPNGAALVNALLGVTAATA
jgi:kumamolisin